MENDAFPSYWLLVRLSNTSDDNTTAEIVEAFAGKPTEDDVNRALWGAANSGGSARPSRKQLALLLAAGGDVNYVPPDMPNAKPALQRLLTDFDEGYSVRNLRILWALGVKFKLEDVPGVDSRFVIEEYAALMQRDD